MWEIINESPVGYEPVYSVIEKETGREIAINLELDEAIKVKHSIDMYHTLKQFNDGIADKLYVNCRVEENDAFLKEANESITRMEQLFHKMNRDYSQKKKDVHKV